ncbi:MAG: glycosyltransferase, partial [Armatimonadota bacterium]
EARILVFADADMSFHPEFVERLVEPIIAGAAAGTFTREEYVRNWNSRLARCWNLNNGLTTPRRHPEGFPERDWVYRAIDRDAFDRAGGYQDVGYGEDAALGRKIGDMAVAVPGAICYHDNPSTWRDVFLSARWYGRGETVDRSWRGILNLTLPWSLKKSLRRAISCREPLFPVFKVVHDFAVLVGIIETRFLGRGHKK